MPTEQLPKSRFRLLLDTPQEFCTEQGFVRFQHCSDFRPGAGDLVNCVRDPLTSCIMLEPSFMSPNWYTSGSWEPLSNWRIPLTSETYWNEVDRGRDPDLADTLKRFWSTVSPGNGDLVQQLTDVAIASVSLTSAFASDVLVWAMQSNFMLAADEGFVWHYRTMTDEHNRPRNWFALQWSDILLHFSTDGIMRCYRYENGLNNTPTLFDEHRICYPGDLLNKEGYIIFLPLPGYGLGIYHSRTAKAAEGKGSSSFFGSINSGHLVRLPMKDAPGGGQNVTTSTKITLALASNLVRMQHIMGFHRVRYPSSGIYWDNTFSPGYLPNIAPSLVNAYTTFAGSGAAGTTAASASLWKPNKSGGFQFGDGAARIKATLSTSNPRYTPLVQSTEVVWAPVYAERDTTPIEPRLWQLQFSEDELGRFEGRAVVMARTDAERKVVERGDTTFELQTSSDDGATWQHFAGGFARVSEDVRAAFTTAGMHYEVSLDLHDMFARFGEVGSLDVHAFDEMTLGNAIRRILLVSGMPDLESIPAEFAALTFPKSDNADTFKFAPKAGARGDDLIKDFLLFARRQQVEWFLRYRWDTNKFVLQQRIFDESESTNKAWRLTPYSDEIPNRHVSVVNRQIAIGDEDGMTGFEFAPSPPECNILQPFGLSDTNPNTATKVVGRPIFNVASVTDKASPDYLGRVIGAYPMIAGITDKDEIIRMTLRLEAATMHRRILAVVPSVDFVPGFSPINGSRANIVGMNDAGQKVPIFAGQWLKKRVVTINYQQAGEVAIRTTYHTDSRWESEVR